MDWLIDVRNWIISADGREFSVGVVVPFVAIVVAGVVAALIGRGTTKRVLSISERETRVAAVATMIGAARRASVWNTLGAPEQAHSDHISSEADVRIRLLSVPGTAMAADWAAHQLQAMKRDSISFSFQAEQTLIDFRNRMVAWQARPGRAKKLFKGDLDAWAYEDTQATKDIVSQQQAWAAFQVAPEASPVASTTDLPPAAAAAPPPSSSIAAAEASTTVSAPLNEPVVSTRSEPVVSTGSDSAHGRPNTNDLPTEAIWIQDDPDSSGLPDDGMAPPLVEPEATHGEPVAARATDDYSDQRLDEAVRS